LTAEKVLKITRDIVRERQITTLMITHNMESSLQLGNRTILLDDGNIVLDLKGETRENLDVPGLLELYRKAKGQDFDNDRMLLS
ncbi:MAG: ABC transporter ATP-binding protein, partial [Clostridia bacterium]|nr:ABC transporter ATP-binding protein [Clostridia bacterium]